MKACTLVLTWFAVSSAGLLGAPPAPALTELNSSKLTKFMVRTDQLPSPLRRALAKTFHQNDLKLGNPGELVGGSVTYTGDPARSAPYRRLIFAFETQRYAYVYYQKGDPENGAACLIFDITDARRPRFVWGGADLETHFARNPSELRNRIQHGKLWDDHPYIW